MFLSKEVTTLITQSPRWQCTATLEHLFLSSDTSMLSQIFLSTSQAATPTRARKSTQTLAHRTQVARIILEGDGG